jgi:hypothetical protein
MMGTPMDAINQISLAEDEEGLEVVLEDTRSSAGKQVDDWKLRLKESAKEIER